MSPSIHPSMFLIGRGNILIFGNLQIQRRRTTSYPARDVVVRSVARAEPTAEIACFTDGHTAQMGADAQHDEPLGVLDAVRVRLWVSQRLDLDLVCLFDLVGCWVADEDGFSTPFYDHLFPPSVIWLGFWRGREEIHSFLQEWKKGPLPLLPLPIHLLMRPWLPGSLHRSVPLPPSADVDGETNPEQQLWRQRRKVRPWFQP